MPCKWQIGYFHLKLRNFILRQRLRKNKKKPFFWIVFCCQFSVILSIVQFWGKNHFEMLCLYYCCIFASHSHKTIWDETEIHTKKNPIDAYACSVWTGNMMMIPSLFFSVRIFPRNTHKTNKKINCGAIVSRHFGSLLGNAVEIRTTDSR